MSNNSPQKYLFDAQKVLNHVSQKWGFRTCPLCGERNWNVNDTVFELREFHGGSMVLGGGQLIPVIPIVCGNCGNVVLLNAIIAGAVKNQNS